MKKSEKTDCYKRVYILRFKMVDPFISLTVLLYPSTVSRPYHLHSSNVT